MKLSHLTLKIVTFLTYSITFDHRVTLTNIDFDIDHPPTPPPWGKHHLRTSAGPPRKAFVLEEREIAIIGWDR